MKIEQDWTFFPNLLKSRKTRLHRWQPTHERMIEGEGCSREAQAHNTRV